MPRQSARAAVEKSSLPFFFMASNWTERRVVVTGLGVVTALGQSPRAFWENILAGKCGVRPITFFDASAFTTRIAAEIPDFDSSAAFPSPK